MKNLQESYVDWMNIVMKNDIPEQGGVIKSVIESVWRISIYIFIAQDLERHHYTLCGIKQIPTQLCTIRILVGIT